MNRTYIAFLFVTLSAALEANSGGADPRLTGAPGDETCNSCHGGSALNGPAGSVKIKLPGPNTYTPGVKQRIAVEVADSSQKRWGFELTARLASEPKNGQAGSLASADGNTQVICDDGRMAPCSAAATVQFITHTASGTRIGTANSAVFEFDWTPPSTDLGKVTFYAAGNAANGNGSNAGDRIYTASADLSPAVTAPKPSVTSAVSAASQQAVVSPNTWLTINGVNLAATTRTWTAGEIAGGTMPTALENVSVTVNGKAAFVQYVSPAQINILTPADDAEGPVEIKVTSNGVTGDANIVTMQRIAPALFTLDGKYLATSAGDNADLTKSNLFLGGADRKAPVKPGGAITLYGTGFGAADAGGVLLTQPSVTIGGMPATVISGVLTATPPQVYVFEVQVPDGLPDGDHAVVMQAGGVSTPSGADCCVITIQRQ